MASLTTDPANRRAGTAEVSSVAELFHALGHPLRLTILCAFDGAPASSSELERRMQAGLAVVAYHVRRLYDEGWLELVETRRVRGSLESFYALTDRGRWARDVVDAALAVPPWHADDSLGDPAAALPLALRARGEEVRDDASALRAESGQARRRAREIRGERAATRQRALERARSTQG